MLNYTDKHFIQYSIVNQEVVEAQPDKLSWDLLFTRYNIVIPTGPGMTMIYPVTGVISNPDVKTTEVSGVPVQSATFNAAELQSGADVIGYDWKVSDPVTHEVSIADSLSYFIESVDGNTYQLYFTEYGGLGQGTIGIKTKNVQ